MSDLLAKQQLFMRCFSKLLNWGQANGYEFTGGQLKRTQEEADTNAASGAGISNSLHRISLAVDLNIFKAGEWINTLDGYRPLGEFWKTLDPAACWGGDFRNSKGLPKPDADHFSISYQGVK